MMNEAHDTFLDNDTLSPKPPGFGRLGDLMTLSCSNEKAIIFKCERADRIKKASRS